MEPGDLIDLDVTDVAHGGVFVGRHDGRVVFVPDALPGERVRVRLTDVSKPAFWRGEALEILDASPHRRRHVWRQADVDVPPELRPGGADFGHIELSHQRELKLHVLVDALTRMGAMSEASVSITGAWPAGGDLPDETADGTGWRTRVSLHVDAEGRVGPYAARSHRVVPVDDLPLATPAVEQAALRIPRAAPGRIDLVEPADGRVRVIRRPERGRDARRRPRRSDHRAGTSRSDLPGRSEREEPRGDSPHETVVERVRGRDFRVDAGGFWQVHRLAATSLSQLVAGALQGLAPDGPVERPTSWIDPDAWHLDLYGGVGLFAAMLGELGGPSTQITSVESDPRATEHAAENLAEWVGARAETDRVDRWVARLSAEATAAQRERLSRGVVLLDPPRSGAGREVVEGVAALRPATVVYVACDPVALARDLATFRHAGYATRSVDAVDLFPNSHHVEAVAVLQRDAR